MPINNDSPTASPIWAWLIPACRWANGLRFLSCIFVVLALAGCAGSVAPPTIVTPLTAEQRGTLRLTAVTTDAAPGVAVTAAVTARITQLVMADIQVVAPGLVDAAAVQGKTMRITITRYDEGSAGARFLLAGLGQIRLEGSVFILDTPSGKVIAEYQVAKQFSFGGIYGAVTTIEDVEKGFAQSVAALLKPGS